MKIQCATKNPKVSPAGCDPPSDVFSDPFSELSSELPRRKTRISEEEGVEGGAGEGTRRGAWTDAPSLFFYNFFCFNI